MRAAEELWFSVRQRAQGRCEYCHVQESVFLFPHHVDHVRAIQHGGLTILENLALACPDCNRLKGPNLSSVDPDTNLPAWLFNPRRDRWSEHFTLEGAFIRGLTAVGRATVFLLQFNAEERLKLRQRLLRLGLFP